MKRILIGLMTLAMCGFVSGADVLIANGTGQTIQFVMYDTAGAEKTALTYSGIAVAYVIDRAVSVDVTEIEGSDPNIASEWQSGKIIEVDATHNPGLYRFDVPNAACVVAAGTKRVSFYFTASGCKVTKAYYDLTPSVNVVLSNGTTVPTVNITSGVVEANVVQSGGATAPAGAIPNAAAGAAGGIAIVGSEMTADVTKIHGSALTETAGQLAAAFTKFFNVGTPTGTVNSLPDAVAGAANGLSIVGSQMGLANDAITAAKIAADAIGSSELADTATAEIAAANATNTTWLAVLAQYIHQYSQR